MVSQAPTNPFILLPPAGGAQSPAPSKAEAMCDSQIIVTSSELSLSGPWGEELEGYREKKRKENHGK